MTTQRIHPSGAWRVSEMVTDGHETWLESEQYMGYTKAEAKRMYLEMLKHEGWAVAYRES